jgi:hypothetical protein
MLEECDELVGFGSRIPLEFFQFPQALAATQRCTFCRENAGVCEVEVGFRMCMPLEFQGQETARVAVVITLEFCELGGWRIWVRINLPGAQLQSYPEARRCEHQD